MPLSSGHTSGRQLHRYVRFRPPKRFAKLFVPNSFDVESPDKIYESRLGVLKQNNFEG